MTRWFWLILLMAWFGVTGPVRADSSTQLTFSPQTVEAAKAIAKITGIAISPLLGTAGLGAYEYFTFPKEKKSQLPWFANPFFWLPALLLVGVVAAKDAFGTALPPGLKKPLDVAETIENKVSGLVAAGAVVPLIASIFGHGGTTAATLPPVYLAGFAAFNFSSLLNIFTIPVALTAYAVVWLLGHVINILILISPFGVVDAALKTARTTLIASLVIVTKINPITGAILSLIIIFVAYLLAGWSFRLLMFGSVYVWDFVTGRRRRFHPEPQANWMFTSRKIDRTPIRTYGKLGRTENGRLAFEYRTWLFFGTNCTLTLPEGEYAVGRGLFYPEIMLLVKSGEKQRTMLLMPPRYRTHEDKIAKIYNFPEVRDVGLLRGFKAIWNWLKSLFGLSTRKEDGAVVCEHAK